MASKKYYAVKKGKTPGIYENWDECKANIQGVSGAIYKGFATKEEATLFLHNENSTETNHNIIKAEPIVNDRNNKKNIKPKDGKEKVFNEIDAIKPGSEKELLAYVDGSYEHSLLKYAFGCVFLTSDGKVYVQNGSGNDPETAKQRNVAGEMLGAMYAARFALKNGYESLEIRYDYEGIEKWVTGEWRAKTELTGKYREYMQNLLKNIHIRFTKVAAHTNVTFNELADQMAKEGLLSNEGIPQIVLKEELKEWNP